MNPQYVFVDKQVNRNDRGCDACQLATIFCENLAESQIHNGRAYAKTYRNNTAKIDKENS